MANKRQKTKAANACHSRVQTSAHNFLWPENCISSQYINWQPQFVQAYQGSGMCHSTCSCSRAHRALSTPVWGSHRSEKINFYPWEDAVTPSPQPCCSPGPRPHHTATIKVNAGVCWAHSCEPVNDSCLNYHCKSPSIFFLFSHLLPFVWFFISPSTRFLPSSTQ